MKEVTAFEAETDQSIHRSKERARQAEFSSLMRLAATDMPALGSVSTKSIYEWMTMYLRSGVYAPALPKLLFALNYLAKHHLQITGYELFKPDPPALSDAD